jgi:endonuclease/exonuclease/phosphatase (EEP) superfamily protein YafD
MSDLAAVMWLVAGLYLTGALVVLVTLLPIWRTSRWWVRVWDFPRFQTALVALAVLVAVPLVRRPTGIDLVVLSAVGAALAWQISWVWRYLPGAPREVPRVDAPPGAPACLALLTTNVLQDNRSADRLLQVVMQAGPDVVLAVETDEWWCARLDEALGSHYPHKVRHPLSTGYGIALFSRLELVEPAVRFVLDPAIPSIRTGVRLRSGAIIDLYGLHPRPPGVLQDSTERDLELVRVGHEIAERGRPAILLGDLNDVAWSPSTRQFAKAGRLLDPRRGRGFYNTYPARLPGLRYPLDYVFNTEHFAIVDMRVLPPFGSDHLPLIATLMLRTVRRPGE